MGLGQVKGERNPYLPSKDGKSSLGNGAMEVGILGVHLKWIEIEKSFSSGSPRNVFVVGVS